MSVHEVLPKCASVAATSFGSSALVGPLSKEFVAALEAFAREEIPVIPFRKGQRKVDVVAEQRKKF